MHSSSTAPIARMSKTLKIDTSVKPVPSRTQHVSSTSTDTHASCSFAQACHLLPVLYVCILSALRCDQYTIGKHSLPPVHGRCGASMAPRTRSPILLRLALNGCNNNAKQPISPTLGMKQSFQHVFAHKPLQEDIVGTNKRAKRS